jgi:hypothetical protein
MQYMSYTKIPLEKLESTRLRLRADLKELEKQNGEKYRVRTFYLGPRKVFEEMTYKRRQGTTNKPDAYAAKLAVYRVQKDSDWAQLQSYV